MINFAVKYQETSRELKNQFKRTESRDWNIQTICLEFMVQLGHLSYMLYKNEETLPCPFIKDEENISDEVCDLFFQIFNLANFINLDLSKELSERARSLEIKMFEPSKIIIFIDHHIGNLCDCLLLLEGYKQRSDVDRNTLIKKIKDNIIKIYIYVFNLSKVLNIEVDSSFNMMLIDANNYLMNYE